VRTSARLLGSFTTDQLVEVAARSACSFILHQQRQIAFIELLEEVVPRDGLQAVFSGIAGEIQAQDANILFSSGATDAAWMRFALFGPFANLIMIG
jgi:hypothetical protein